jgi:hypothetical protein
MPAAGGRGDVRTACITQVSFDDVKRDATPQQRREFWTKTKRLQHGTLICLVVPPAARAEGAGEELLVFGTVSQRDIEELAPSRPQPGFRPSVGIRWAACWGLLLVASSCCCAWPASMQHWLPTFPSGPCLSHV